ncbi:hypothetical protein [Subtercola lobariae]|nr:hypothetical protein [Subtercola lobariae]
MIGWRRKAKAERENVMSSERLYDLVNQTLLSNFGPLGSYAIARREASDNDDIFHTMLASSVAHNIVSSLIEHKAVVVDESAGSTGSVPAPVSLAPIDLVPVPAELAAAVTALRDRPVAPIAPLPVEIAVVVSSGDYATAAVAELAASEMAHAEPARLASADAS